MTPSLAASPNALPPESVMACTSWTEFHGVEKVGLDRAGSTTANVHASDRALTGQDHRTAGGPGAQRVVPDRDALHGRDAPRPVLGPGPRRREGGTEQGRPERHRRSLHEVSFEDPTIIAYRVSPSEAPPPARAPPTPPA